MKAILAGGLPDKIFAFLSCNAERFLPKTAFLQEKKKSVLGREEK